MKEDLAHSEAVTASLEQTLHMKSVVTFNYDNNELTWVQVTFDGLPQGSSVAEIANESKRAVLAEFKQKPRQLVMGFAVNLDDST
jgi:hypothetical protein